MSKLNTASDPNNPVLSIVVPNYNGAAYLSDFLKSVTDQSFTDWELLMMDDGSDDDSRVIIKDFAEKDSRIRLIESDTPRTGACSRRNAGMSLARGKYICFFDSDDLLPAGSLQYRVDGMDSNPDVDFMVGPAISFDKVPYDLSFLVLGIPIFKDDLAMFIKRFRLPFGVWTNTYRRSSLREFGLAWDESLPCMQDSDFNIRALEMGMKYRYSGKDIPLYFWRTGGNPDSITKHIGRNSGMAGQFYFFHQLSRKFAGGKYNGQLRRFALTLAMRAALVGTGNIPEDIIGRGWCKTRIRCLRWVYRKALLRKIWPVVNLVFFPIEVGKEYMFQIHNRRMGAAIIGKWKKESKK